MADDTPTKPAYNPNHVYFAAFVAIFAWLVNHAIRTDALTQPSTYAGIAVGIALTVTAWLIGRRKR